MPGTQKEFSFHWGGGVVAEEAQVESPHHLPTLQLLKYTEGEAAGNVAVRSCQYGHNGRFRRSPLMMGVEDVDRMREALKATPDLRALLVRLVEE